jgi:hypothetical protein
MAKKVNCELRRYYFNELNEKIAYAVLLRDGKTACAKYLKEISGKKQPKMTKLEIVELDK